MGIAVAGRVVGMARRYGGVKEWGQGVGIGINSARGRGIERGAEGTRA